MTGNSVSLIEAITASGGFAPYAKRKRIKIIKLC